MRRNGFSHAASPRVRTRLSLADWGTSAPLSRNPSVQNRMTNPSSFANYSRRLLAFMERAAVASPEPDEFTALARELCALQFATVPAFRQLCVARGVTPDSLAHWRDIPAMPAAAFKELELTSLLPVERTAVFHSSGTTEHRPSRHYHSSESLVVYEASLVPWFARHMMVGRVCPQRAAGPSEPPTDALGQTRPTFLSLAPPPEQAPHSSLVHMFATVSRAFGAPDSRFVANAGADNSWSLDATVTLTALTHAEQTGQPLVLLGTAFMFVHLLDELEQRALSLALPPGSRVLETGGYKGRSRELPKAELHALLTARLGVPPAAIVCEYGMSELSSQAYSIATARASLQSQVTAGELPTRMPRRTPSPFLGGGEKVAAGRMRGGAANADARNPSPQPSPLLRGRERASTRVEAPLPFSFPPWCRALVISPETGREVPDGETGLLRIFDLANVRSVLALQTEDLAVRRGEGFELLGRATQAEARGCSLLAR